MYFEGFYEVLTLHKYFVKNILNYTFLAMKCRPLKNVLEFARK